MCVHKGMSENLLQTNTQANHFPFNFAIFTYSRRQGMGGIGHSEPSGRQCDSTAPIPYDDASQERRSCFCGSK